jgi:hypothetical protein
MNAVKQEISPIEAIEELVTRYGVFAILRALVAHRIGRRRPSKALRSGGHTALFGARHRPARALV